MISKLKINRLFILLLLVSLPIFSKGFISLEDYVKENAGDKSGAIEAYIAKRCAAVYTTSARVVGNNNKEIFNQHVIQITNFMSVATLIGSEMTGLPAEVQMLTTQKEMLAMVKVYEEMIDESYAKTGMYFPALEEDLKICKGILDSEE